MNEEAHTIAEPAAPPLRILLVEDDEFDVAVFGRAFRRGEIPCEIIRCRNGEEVLEGLRDAELELDLLVTDHQLPGLSGFDLCLDLIKRRPPFALVLLTGVGSEQMAIRALRAGINDYIVKDTSQEYLELLPLVLPRVARRHRQRRHREAVTGRHEAQEVSDSGEMWAGGYRLGLSACADMVRQRGGRVWVEDATGGSPTLHLSVPLAREEVASWTAAGADLDPAASSTMMATDRDVPVAGRGSADPGSRHVLIVHPNPIVTFVARRTAERAGDRVATVESGRKAIEALEREPFDLVLLALSMSDLDGLETARRIRKRGAGGKDVKILALGVDAEATEACREAGIDGTVASPVSIQSLTVAIERLA